MSLRDVFCIVAVVSAQMLAAAGKQDGSLAFVIDTTISMVEEIAQVKKGANKIMDIVLGRETSQIQNIVLTEFNDPRFGLLKKTRRRDELEQALNSIRVGGGGDCAEMSLSGVQLALQQSLPDSYLYVFTDASAKDYRLREAVKSLAQSRGSQVVFILTPPPLCREPDEYFKVYFEIAAATFGQVFRLTRKNQVEQILKYVRETTSGDRAVILSKQIPANKWEDVSFVVDEQTEYATVSASGRDVKLLFRPGQRLSFENITWIENAKVVKLINPKPGRYTARVLGGGITSLMVFGRTDFTFQHSFSTSKPKVWKDVVKQPTDGIEYYLTILVNDPGNSIKINSVQILGMDQKVIKDIPLTEISRHFYTTDLFLPPDSQFLIAVTGKSIKSDRNIRRIAKTPFKPLIRNFKPILTIESTKTMIDYNSDLSLTCGVAAHPAPTVVWKDEAGTVVPSQLSETQPPYRHASRATVNIRRSHTFSCEASNAMGFSIATVNVTVTSPFVIEGKSGAGGVTEVKHGEAAVLNCNIKSSFSMKITWFKELSEIKTSDKYHLTSDGAELRINEMNKDLEGKYVCVAVLLQDIYMKQSFEHNIKLKQQAPELEKLLSYNLKVRETSPVSLSCKVIKGYPKPEITWQFKGLGSNTFKTLSVSGDSLLANRTDLSYSGLYKCIAKNYLGQVEQDVELIVEAPPKALLLTNNKNVSSENIAFNGKVELACVVTGSPQPNIVWKDLKNIVIEAGKITATKQPQEYMSELVVDKIKLSNKYYCEATNDLGKSKSSVEILVLAPLNVLKKHEITNVEYGKETIIHCKITSSYPMKISWFKAIGPKSENYETITTSEKYSISTDGSELKINKMELDLQGKYICEASLLEDESAKTIYSTDVIIDGLVAPRIEKQRSIIKTKEGTPLAIKCKVTNGKPEPDRAWYFKSLSSGVFVDLLESNEQLKVNGAQLDDAGLYKCVAKNIVGKVEQVFELIVDGKPKIISGNDKTDYWAVEGDVALRIPCDVIGHPEPSIVWTVNGSRIMSDKKYSIDNGALVIKNPLQRDTGKYICRTENMLGTDEKKFVAIVTETILDDFAEGEHIYILKGDSKKLECPNSETGTVKWFREFDNFNNTGRSLKIRNAKLRNDGNYTCRVSSLLGAKSFTYVVDVGHKPRFRNDQRTAIDWDGDYMTLDCEVDMKPLEGKIEWKHNGKLLKNANVMSLDISDWGNYTCRIENYHGSVERSFHVTSSGCLIKRSSTIANIPLFLSDDSNTTWPAFETMKQYLLMETKQNVRLSCHRQPARPNVFKRNTNKSDILATCDHEDRFIVDGEEFKFEDFKCSNQILPVIKETGIKCFNKNTELIKVGFTVDNFLEVYQVCFDKIKSVPLYTQLKMTKTYNVEPLKETQWFKHSKIVDVKEDYDCGEGASCCYAKTQLVNAQDVRYGPSQTATFIDRLNSVPIWRACSNSSSVTWHDIEENLRLDIESFSNYTVWSGASNYSLKNGLTVPRHVWKVARYSPDYAVAIVQVNDPAPGAEDALCQEPCPDPGWSYPTYCCSLDEFYSAFKIPANTFD